MKWGILGALNQEIALLIAQMENRQSVLYLGMEFHQGQLRGQETVVACCNPGTINAAISAAALIEHFGVQCIVNCGIAGALAPDLKLLDVIIGDRVVFHDRDPVLLKYPPLALSFAADPRLVEVCRQACCQLQDMSFSARTGTVATGDWFICGSEQKQTIRRSCGADCVEMEGAAVGQVCTLYQLPFLVLRSLSDAADDDANDTYDDWMEQAAQQSAQIILSMLELWEK